MATVRDTLTAEIATIEADLLAKKNQLQQLEVEAKSFLDTEVEKVKNFFTAIGHLL